MDRTQGLLAFVKSVEAGSFSGGARALGTTPSAVSRSIARLEQRLETRLFQRSTRNLSLTEEGQAYFDRIAPLLRDLEDADEVLAPDGAIRGTLRITLPSVLGLPLMDAILMDFLPRHPELRIQASIGDRHADLIAEGFDLALRAGILPDSALTGRPLGDATICLVASPGYLNGAGRPERPADLMAHRHIRYLSGHRPYPIHFADGTVVTPEGHLDVDNGMVMLRGALKGAGIAQLLYPVVADHLASGDLEEVLPQCPLASIPLHFLHAFARRPPARARAFMDFVAARLETQRR
ncbi:LysR substrate-binding domain-containing protein [Sphingobium sp.]|uniref:LysR family transcriptional regulator n=1 Tax=Sphingobium sp. TaxID=1912891 RepID=UPI003B3A93FC